MTASERLWCSIREAAHDYEAPEHLSDERLRKITVALCKVACYVEDQGAMDSSHSTQAVTAAR